jgi:lipoyl(octanoyl) transferase
VSAAPSNFELRDLGRRPYLEVHQLQQILLQQRVEDQIPDTLLLVEHEEIVTLGRSSAPDEAMDSGLPVLAIERGGEATWHGPGQLVAYPILRLREGQRDLHQYLRDLEEVVIRVLGDYGVEGSRVAGLTGVWIGPKKVCSLGVAVRRWVTWHGLALNVSADLSAFRRFRPCGLDPEVMTNLSAHTSRPVSMEAVKLALVQHFREVFRTGI